MFNEISVLIVGIIYLIAGILYYFKSRNNVYDKGFAFMGFAILHGVDELVDGLSLIYNFSNSYQIIIERVEITAFYLSSSFLLIGTFIKLNYIRPKEIFPIGFGVQLPSVLFFLFVPENVIETIVDESFSIGSVNINYTTIFFGIIPTLPLSIIYLSEFLKLYKKNRSVSLVNNKALLQIFSISIMIILYDIGELLTKFNVLFLYLEIIAIIIILMTPVEISIGPSRNLQLFLVYHNAGVALKQTKFNTSLSDDVLILVTSFLTAINVMVSNELDLGNLEKIETGKGILSIKHRGEYIYAILFNQTIPKLLNNFENTVDSVSEYISKNIENYLQMSSAQSSELDEIIIKSFI